MYVVGPRLIDGRVGVVFFGVGGSRSARTLHYIVVSWGGFGGVWGGADNVLGCPPYEINGHHKMSQGVHSMIQQWMWRQTILPCSPKELMSCLVDLLKKYHDFQWRLHPLKQIVWLHCKMTKKHIFPHLITRWSRFNQWHGCVKDPKWTGMLWPL